MYAFFPLNAGASETWGAVEDTGAVQGLQRGNIQAAVGRSGGEDHRSRADVPPVLDRHREPVPRAGKGDRTMHEYEARPERRRLLVGLLGKPTAADALGEAQVVADQRARPRLSTDAALVHHENAQPLGGAIDGRRQARRPRADDYHVECVFLQPSRSPCRLRDLGVRGIVHDPAVRKHHEGELRIGAYADE